MSDVSGVAMANEAELGSTRTEQTQHKPSPPRSTIQPKSSLPALRKQVSTGRLPGPSLPPSHSPRGSRTTSPLRKETTLRTGPNAQTTAAPIQRALSASDVSQLATDNTPRLPRPHNMKTGNVESPQVTSPATKNSTASDTKKDISMVPSISVQPTALEKPPLQSPRAMNSEGKNELQTPKAASRGPSGKSILATVDENSSDAAEVKSNISAADLRPLTKLTDEDKATDSDRVSRAVESGSESGGNKSDGLSSRRATLSQAPKRSKNSYTALAKARPPEGTRNMTVETETVQSIPHSGLSSERNSSSRTDGSGTVKMKSSNETIRPKKERRYASKKTRSITQGVASTKADLFEARVASAVDEANTSDSDETFVYESNPPDPRPRRHHSRTPSVTSAHSTTDQNRGIRSFGEAMDERRVAGKRSMKFSANPFQSDDSPSDQNGTVRSHQARHYGRWGRGGSHASMFEPDSPFTQASKLRSNQHSIRHSRPNSPRGAHGTKGGPPVFGRKKDSPFDFDLEGADDERTPLMGTVRTPRSSRHHIRVGSHADDAESIDEYYGLRSRSRCGTLGSFFLGLLIFGVVVISTIGFLAASNRPLAAVHIRRIDNVLATDQEILLDLRVGAINPNALSIAIVDVDLSLNAKSKDTSHKPEFLEAKDPSHGEDDEDDAQPLLALGHVMHFDQPLEFAGTPLKQSLQFSTGGLHLAQPGNKTGSDGSTRWEKMLHHPFELILRGVLKYKLPISAREESVEVMTSMLVHPEDGVDSAGRMRVEPIDHTEHWQWIDWDRETKLDESSSVEVGAFE